MEQMVSELYKKANEGDISAQYSLGEHYYQDGHGHLDNNRLKMAHTWFLRAADNGNLKAMVMAAELYCDCRLYKDAFVNGSKIVQLLQRAADRGYPKAIYRLGIQYETGMGFPKNKKQAFKLYLKAAELGYLQAISEVGEIYARPKTMNREALAEYGVEENVLVGMKWLEKAIDQYDPQDPYGDVYNDARAAYMLYNELAEEHHYKKIIKSARIPEIFHFPKDPIRERKVLIDLFSTMVLRGYIEAGVDGGNIRYLDNQQMNQLFEGTLKAFPNYTGDMIKKSIKICYKSDAWFGISTKARNSFLVDLRDRVDEMVDEMSVDERVKNDSQPPHHLNRSPINRFTISRNSDRLQTADSIVKCSQCGTLNRLQPSPNIRTATCGNCHNKLTNSRDNSDRPQKADSIVKCSQCGTLNRVRPSPNIRTATCGNCHNELTNYR